MPVPEGWDAAAAVSACQLIPWGEPLWRFHKRGRGPLDHNGYLYASGRFNRGVPDFGEDNAWPALYLSTAPHIALGEKLRHITPLTLADLNDVRLTGYRVNLAGILDCRDLAPLKITFSDLLEDTDYALGQTLAAAALGDERVCEGILVPTATRFDGWNLVYFPLHPRPDSTLIPITDEDPHLYVPRTAT